ncbi:MAG: type IV pilus assembly protein PilM [Candidatus Omnitrophica bacterium]|nr:type IV pilus assembly protein PilM [Candidatus Omnitrophota bacterium]
MKIFKEQIDKFTRIFKKDFIIGLDIGTSSIKLAQFLKKEDGLYLVKADLREIKQSEDSSLREQEIVFALKDLFRGIDIKKSKVIAVINCPKTAIKIIKAPYMPRAELRDGLNLEAKNYFPFPIDDSFLDYEILGDVVEKGNRKYEIAVSVSPKPTVKKYLLLLGKAGIKPASFIPSSYALQKAVGDLSAEDKALVFVDIGKLHTELIIYRGRYLLFSRKIPVALDEFTKAMTGALVSGRGRIELTFDEAEKIKQETGIPAEAESRIIEDKISTTQVLSMLRAPLEQLVSEIERCFDYYREESAGGKIDSLVLFGGGASLGGLIKYLSEGLGIEVKLGDTFEKLRLEGNAVFQRDKVLSRLELAVGAAQSVGKGINLLPAEIKEETKRAFKRSGLEAAVVGGALVLFYIGMSIQLNNFQKKISASKLELASLEPQLKQAAIFRLLAKEPYWDDVFKELSNIITSNIYLTELSMENNLIRMRGIVNSPEPEESVANFILTLERGLFKSVKLITTKEITGKAANEFEITCWLDEKSRTSPLLKGGVKF